MTEIDSKPWYCHFYPWLVIVLLGSAIGSSLFTVYLAMSTAAVSYTHLRAHET